MPAVSHEVRIWIEGGTHRVHSREKGVCVSVDIDSCLVEDLSTRTRRGSATAIWNQVTLTD
jgi:hypothetical protein